MKASILRVVRRIRRSNQIDALNARIAELDAQLAAREQAHVEYANLRDTQLAKLSEDIQDQRSVANALVSQADKLRAECDDLQERLRVVKTERDALHAQLEEARLESDAATAEYRQAVGGLGALGASIDSMQGALSQALTEAGARREEAAAARAERDLLVAVDQDLAERKRELAIIRCDFAELSLQLDAYKAECQRLGQSETELMRELAARKAWLSPETADAMLASVRHELQSSLNSLGADNAQLTAQREALLQETIDLKRSIQIVQVEHAGDVLAKRNAETVLSLRRSGARRRLIEALLLDPASKTADRRAIFTLHKTASTFVWRLMSYLSEILNLPIHSPNGVAAEYISDEINIRSNLNAVKDRHGVFGPFRGYIDFPDGTFSRSVVILRDPRDVLVSLYYSWAYSHPIDDGRLSLVNSRGELFNPTDEEREA